MILEPARQSDRKAVNALAVQVNDLHVAWSPDFYQHMDEIYTDEIFREELESKNLYVVRRGETVIAYIRVRVGEAGPVTAKRSVLYLEEICVDAGCRHQGIGTQTMADLKALARELGCGEIRLSVAPQNAGAIALYENMGFSLRILNYQAMI